MPNKIISVASRSCVELGYRPSSCAVFADNMKIEHNLQDPHKCRPDTAEPGLKLAPYSTVLVNFLKASVSNPQDTLNRIRAMLARPVLALIDRCCRAGKVSAIRGIAD